MATVQAMANRPEDHSRALHALKGKLTRWRVKHGGPGRRIPEEIWSAAVELARMEGVEPIAHALRLNAERLERRVEDAEGIEITEFVEITGEVAGTSVVSVKGPRGERLLLELPSSASAAGAVVAAFLSELERK